jgi:hypothetical protein
MVSNSTIKNIAEMYDTDTIRQAYFYCILLGADEFIDIQLEYVGETMTFEDRMESAIDYALCQLNDPNASPESETVQDLTKIYTENFKKS